MVAVRLGAARTGAGPRDIGSKQRGTLGVWLPCPRPTSSALSPTNLEDSD